mgnify:CR=1 FL=1
MPDDMAILSIISKAIYIAAIGQFVLIIASLAIPSTLNWKSDTAKLRPLTRQVFWTYAAYIWVTNLSFAIISLKPNYLLDHSPLASAVTAFIAIYWLGRICIQFFYFDRSDAPSGWHFKIAEIGLVLLFTFLSITYSAAFLFNTGLIGVSITP